METSKTFIEKLNNDSEQKRTLSQNSAMHLWFTQVAEAMRQEGLDMNMALVPKIGIMPTMVNVKEMLWRPVQIAMFGKVSTTDLLKQKEIDDIYDVLNKHLSQMGIIVPPFPATEENL